MKRIIIGDHLERCVSDRNQYFILLNNFTRSRDIFDDSEWSLSPLYTINITDNSSDNLLKCISRIDYTNIASEPIILPLESIL